MTATLIQELGQRLRDQYGSLLNEPLPERHRDLVLLLAVAEALTDA